jgi:hypothetical protein
MRIRYVSEREASERAKMGENEKQQKRKNPSRGGAAGLPSPLLYKQHVQPTTIVYSASASLTMYSASISPTVYNASASVSLSLQSCTTPPPMDLSSQRRQHLHPLPARGVQTVSSVQTKIIICIRIFFRFVKL